MIKSIFNQVTVNWLLCTPRQTLDEQTLDMQEQVFRCRALIAYTDGNGLASASTTVLVASSVIIHTLIGVRSSTPQNICGHGYSP